MEGSTNHRPKGRPGYFLLEVVLALGIAAAVLYGVFAIANGSLAISTALAEEGADAIEQEAFLTFMGRNFEQLPGNAVLDLKRQDAGSHYTSDLTFQNVPVSFSWAGQAISAEAIQLSAVLRRDGDLDIVLRYYEEAILDDSDSTAEVNAEPLAEITLLRDVWRFEWWALDGRTMEWTEEWDVRGRMPLQLELNVVFSRTGEEVIHYFWIPPKVNPETIARSTALNPASQRGGGDGGEGGAPGDVRVRPGDGGGQGRGGDRGRGDGRGGGRGGAGTGGGTGGRGGGGSPPVPGGGR